MLEIERFDPPTPFWLAKATELLDCETEPSEALNATNPP
jgi:hypothetical protein